MTATRVVMDFVSNSGAPSQNERTALVLVFSIPHKNRYLCHNQIDGRLSIARNYVARFR